jgi:hypothetical protein
MKTCKSCAHYYNPWFDSSWRGIFGLNVLGPQCKKAPRHEVRDPVTGRVTDPAGFWLCEYLRIGDARNECGESGKWWEPNNS